MDVFKKIKSFFGIDSENFYDNKIFLKALEKSKSKLDHRLYSFLHDIYEKSTTVLNFEKLSQEFSSMLQKGKPRENVSPIIPTEEHRFEYANRAISYKILEMAEYIPHFRKIRGDGNCFYRAIGFAFIEKLLFDLWKLPNEKNFIAFVEFFKEIQGSKEEMCEISLAKDYNPVLYRIIEKILQYKEVLEIVFLRGCSYVILLLHDAKSHKDFRNKFEEFFSSNPLFDISMIYVFRVLIFRTLKQNLQKEEYAPFLISPEIYLTKLMIFGEEAENILVPITADALRRNIIINMIHVEKEKAIYYKEKYAPLINGEKQVKDMQKINLYFRPGHYDLGYEKNHPIINEN